MNIEFHFRGALIQLQLGLNHRRKGWFAGVYKDWDVDYREGDDHLYLVDAATSKKKVKLTSVQNAT